MHLLPHPTSMWVTPQFTVSGLKTLLIAERFLLETTLALLPRLLS